MGTSAVTAAWSSGDIGRQLDKILQSSPFRNSHRQQRLLKYLVEALLNDSAHRIKGYTLAVEVFDKGSDFDPDSSALVRVEMGRLRSKLLEYYTGEGQDDSLVFDLPKGKYLVGVSSKSSGMPTFNFNERALARAPDQQPSIAVLPFSDLSERSDQGWFAEGVYEDLILELSKISGLTVCSRYASGRYKGDLGSLADIATSLRVRYLLQGSVRRAANQVRISATLTDTWNAQSIWADRFDGSGDNALTVQGELAGQIVNELRVRLTPLEQLRLGHPHTFSSMAYEAYLKGLQQLWMYSERSNRQAQVHFCKAIELESDFASAHAWLVRSRVYDYTMRWAGADLSTLNDASRAVDHAIELDGLLPMAHAMRSWVSLWQGRFAEAIESGRKAVALDPNNADTRVFLSVALSLSQQGAEALLHSEIALMLNPAPTTLHLWAHGMAQLYTERLNEAAATFAQGIQVGAGFLPNHLFRIHSLIESGREKEARQAAEVYIRQNGSPLVVMRSPGLASDVPRKWVLSVRKVGLIAPD